MTGSSLGKTAGAHSLAQDNTERFLALIIALFAISAFLTLYLFRGLDDNRLVSWQWVFADINIALISVLLVGSLIVAYALSRLSVLEDHPAIILFLFSFLVSVALWRVPEVNVDAARYFTQAKYLSQYGLGGFLSGWGREISAWTDLPLIPLLYGTIFSLIGETRVAIQAFTTLLFSGTIVLTYLVGKSLWNKSVGFYGGALLLGMPYLLTQVPLMLIDVPAMFFFILAVFALVKAIRQGGVGWIALAGVAATLSLLSKYSLWAFLTVAPIIVVVHFREGRGRALRRTVAIGLTTLVLIGTIFTFWYELFMEQVRFLFTYQIAGLARWRESFASTFLFQMHPFIPALGVFSLIPAFRNRDLKHAIISWPLLLALLTRMERSRYLLPLFPMVALMASYGLHTLGGVRVRRFVLFSIVWPSLVVTFLVYNPYLMKMSAVNLKEAGGYLNSLDGDTIEVFALPQTGSSINPVISVPLLDIFTTKKIIYHPLPLTPPEDVERLPLRFTWDYKLPPYYAAQPGGNGAAKVLILGHPSQPLPDEVEGELSGYHLSQTFMVSERRFRYQTLVKIYEPDVRL